MPMNFIDMDSLIRAGKVHKFRPPNLGESEVEYRLALARHVRPIDRIESFEIEFGIGWNKWNEKQKMLSLFG